MKDFYDIDALSEWLCIKKSSLYSMAARGDIPCFKIGRLIRFRKADIDHWLEGLRRVSEDADIKAKSIVKELGKGRDIDVEAVVKKAIEYAKKEVVSSGQRNQAKSGSRKED